MKKKRETQVFLSKNEIREKNDKTNVEIQMNKKIKEINNHSKHFVTFSFSNVVVREKNERKQVLNELFMFTYKGQNLVSFFSQNILQKYNSNFYVLWYRHLLQTLQLLNKKNICYFHWNKESIVFDMESEQPLLQNFGDSFDLDKTTFNFNLTSWVPEWKILVHLYKNNLQTLSFSDVCDLGEDFEQKKYIGSLINQKREKVTQIISEWVPTWDLYCLNLIFVKLKTLPDFLSILLENYLNKEPQERQSVDSFILLFESKIREKF